jgi:hypothetical protein
MGLFMDSSNRWDMNFDYQDLKFWLEDKDVLPQAIGMP